MIFVFFFFKIVDGLGSMKNQLEYYLIYKLKNRLNQMKAQPNIHFIIDNVDNDQYHFRFPIQQ
jgi:hypothetical protein